MKILYAASNKQNSSLQLSRFLKYNTNHIKIAAYKISSPTNTNIDWTLDALLNVLKPEKISIENNDNLYIYYDQIKKFKPDLIISDLEYFTSYLGQILNIPVWQYSSSLLNYSLQEKYNLGLFKLYAHALNRDNLKFQQWLNIIVNSDRNLVVSHFGDTCTPPTLLDRFEWTRPYHQIGKKSVPCQHYLVAGFSKNNSQILDILKRYSDSVVFMEMCAEKYNNIQIKNLQNEEEYYCNLYNSLFFVCQGQASFLADAFYNKKYSFVFPNYSDPESIINSHLTEKFKLGKIMTTFSNSFQIKENDLDYADNSIQFLHQKIKEL